ncbi:hypothetical protein MN608_00600 [Microdochium nivale]|nr:hypothetical protein MN608_00600 [Microdochium nivale]
MLMVALEVHSQAQIVLALLAARSECMLGVNSLAICVRRHGAVFGPDQLAELSRCRLDDTAIQTLQQLPCSNCHATPPLLASCSVQVVPPHSSLLPLAGLLLFYAIIRCLHLLNASTAVIQPSFLHDHRCAASTPTGVVWFVPG